MKFPKKITLVASIISLSACGGSSTTAPGATTTPSTTAATATPAPAAIPASVASATAGAGQRVFASPLARRVAMQGGVELTVIQGSGPHGRVVKSDVEAAMKGEAARAPMKAVPTAVAAAATTAPSAIPDARLYFAKDGYDEIPHDSMPQRFVVVLGSVAGESA